MGDRNFFIQWDIGNQMIDDFFNLDMRVAAQGKNTVYAPVPSSYERQQALFAHTH